MSLQLEPDKQLEIEKEAALPLTTADLSPRRWAIGKYSSSRYYTWTLLPPSMALYKYGSSSKPSSSRLQTTEFEVLKASHKWIKYNHISGFYWQTLRFLREDEDKNLSWNDQVAQKYYSSLYREFAVCDLKHYKSGNVCHSNYFGSLQTDLIFSLHYDGVQKQKCSPELERQAVEIRGVCIMILASHHLHFRRLSCHLPMWNKERQNLPWWKSYCAQSA